MREIHKEIRYRCLYSTECLHTGANCLGKVRCCFTSCLHHSKLEQRQSLGTAAHILTRYLGSYLALKSLGTRSLNMFEDLATQPNNVGLK